jgi:hypothetical protein
MATPSPTQEETPGTTSTLILDLPNYTVAALEELRSPQAYAYTWLEEHPELDTLPGKCLVAF